jgi:Cu(I)/Ag(I) efflux system membrane fusion protein
MTKSLVAGVIAVVIAAGAGYFAGSRRHDVPSSTATVGAVGAPAPGPAAAPEAAPGGRKILYYRNPMGLPDTSAVPKKDSMGMDYIPVYEGEEQETGVRIGAEKMQKLGVRTAPVQRRPVDGVVRATGRVEVDERRVFAVTPKFEGYVERLYVNATGQPVARGEPLFDAYSPELLAAQREYAIAAQGLTNLSGADPATVAGMRRLADSALARLRNWDVTDEEIARLAAGGEARRELGFRAPATGFVLEKKAVQGMRFMPGEMLYQIADLSNLWLVADVFEQDLGRVRVGSRARAAFEAYPGQSFDGRVTFVYPTLKADTRSAQVRIELANPGGRLKPAMYARVELQADAARAAVPAVPNSAVIDSGARQVVLVDRGDGRFEPRPVKLGRRGDEFTAVLDGVREGERVVVAANFLIDAESNLRAALGSMTPPAQAPAGGAAGQVVHTGHGRLDDVDATTGALTITHDPIPSLKWPKMTMEFAAANAAVARAAKPGTPVQFEFVERKAGEWVVTRMTPAAAGGSAAAGAQKH